jgi:DNA-binding NarL/FixJ family response regulator
MTERFWSMLPEGTRIVLVCRAGELPELATAVRAGVRAFVTRDCAANELLAAVAAAASDGLHVSAALVEDLVQPTRDPRAQGTVRLGDREVETLRLVAEGLTHRQISNHMGLTEATVSTYVKRIRSKLNATNKAELTLRAVQLGYVAPGGDAETGTRRGGPAGARLAAMAEYPWEAM